MFIVLFIRDDECQLTGDVYHTTTSLPLSEDALERFLAFVEKDPWEFLDTVRCLGLGEDAVVDMPDLPPQRSVRLEDGSLDRTIECMMQRYVGSDPNEWFGE